MNHMKDIADLLGVELGEKFSINGSNLFEPDYYGWHLEEDGLHCGKEKQTADNCLMDLILDKYSIVRKSLDSNPNSAFSFAICTKEDFNRWKEGKTLYICTIGKFATFKAVEPQKYFNKCKEDDKYSEGDFQTYEDWNDDITRSHFVMEYTSPSGDELVIFGKLR